MSMGNRGRLRSGIWIPSLRWKSRSAARVTFFAARPRRGGQGISSLRCRPATRAAPMLNPSSVRLRRRESVSLGRFQNCNQPGMNNFRRHGVEDEYGKQRPTSVRDVALHAKGWKKIRWREGSKGWLESRFLAVRVQPSHGFVDGEPPHKEVWLLVQWPEEEKEPTRYFLCDLPPSTTLRRLVRAAKSRWKIEQDYLQLKDELGL